MEPSKFPYGNSEVAPQNGTFQMSCGNLKVAQKREPCGSLFCLLVLDCSTFAHGVVQDFFTDSEGLGSYLQKFVCVDEVQCLLQA